MNNVYLVVAEDSASDSQPVRAFAELEDAYKYARLLKGYNDSEPSVHYEPENYRQWVYDHPAPEFKNENTFDVISIPFTNSGETA